MTTTHLFVELLVIGFGALVWIALLAAALFGWDLSSLQNKTFSVEALFPMLSLAYVFGILTDRVADWIFEFFWDKGHLHEVYGSSETDKKQYFEDRRTLIVDGPELWQFVEYGRSRLRICRGWVINAIGLFVGVIVFLKWGEKAPTLKPLQFWICLFVLALFVFLCWKSWNKLNYKEYKKIQRQAEWVRKQVDEQARLAKKIELSGSLIMSREDEDESAEE